SEIRTTPTHPGDSVGGSSYTPSDPIDPDQTITQTANTNVTVTYYVRINNESNTAETFSVTGTDGEAGKWMVEYKDITGTDITSLITSTGWTPYIPGQYQPISYEDITVLVIPLGGPSGPDGGDAYSVTITSTSTTDLGKSDQVRASTQVNISDQPDLSISNDNSVFSGTGIYEYPTPGADQIKEQSIVQGQTITYYIKLTNDGNRDDKYTIDGPSSDADWTIAYYEE
ncbi:unnamed protein product, partial [marine sediment metagenome]